MTTKQLLEIADNKNIKVYDFPMRELRAMSLSGGYIAMDKRKFESGAEYKCGLAHEIGHCETDSFYNINTTVSLKDLKERQANRFAAELLVPLSELCKAVQQGAIIPRTLAMLFDVTIEFINMVLDLYEQELLSFMRGYVYWKTSTSVSHQRIMYNAHVNESAQSG